MDIDCFMKDVESTKRKGGKKRKEEKEEEEVTPELADDEARLGLQSRIMACEEKCREDAKAWGNGEKLSTKEMTERDMWLQDCFAACQKLPMQLQTKRQLTLHRAYNRKRKHGAEDQEMPKSVDDKKAQEVENVVKCDEWENERWRRWDQCLADCYDHFEPRGDEPPDELYLRLGELIACLGDCDWALPDEEAGNTENMEIRDLILKLNITDAWGSYPSCFDYTIGNLQGENADYSENHQAEQVNLIKGR